MGVTVGRKKPCLPQMLRGESNWVFGPIVPIAGRAQELDQ